MLFGEYAARDLSSAWAGPTAGVRDEMLPVNWDTIRLFLHVLAATVWVGGQLTLAALVPALRGLGTEIPRSAARAFNRVACAGVRDPAGHRGVERDRGTRQDHR